MRRPNFFRIPSLKAAFVGSVAVLLAFVAWAFLDPMLPNVFELVRRAVQLEGLPGSAECRYFASRLFIVGALVLTGLAFFGLFVVRLFFGKPTERSLKGLFFAITLVGIWMTLFLSSHAILEAGFCWRLRRAIPDFRLDAAVLLADWPSDDGVLPHAGEFKINAEEENAILIKEYPGERFRETVGPSIFKAGDGAICFNLNPQLKRRQFAKLEYRPDGSEPRPMLHFLRKHQLQRSEHIEGYVTLEPHWHLVWYTLTVWRQVNDDGP